jgi:endonuclease YncB( thermonuclease family)
MKKGTKKILLVIGIIILFVLIFVLTFDHGAFLKNLTGSSIGQELNQEMKQVTKVIDGDTLLIEDGVSVRLLGIDADERGYPCYYQAKNRLEELVLGKEVYLERGKEDKDIYDRELRYILYDGENINLKLVQEGLVIARIEQGDKYQEDFINAENIARENRIGCKWNNSNWLPGSNIAQTNNWVKLVGDAVPACQAQNFVGQDVIIEGKVVDVYTSSSNTVFINFEKPYPNSCFTAVIFKSDLKKFTDVEQYTNQFVRVKGKIKIYEGKPEVILENEDMIEIGQ